MCHWCHRFWLFCNGSLSKIAKKTLLIFFPWLVNSKEKKQIELIRSVLCVVSLARISNNEWTLAELAEYCSKKYGLLDMPYVAYSVIWRPLVMFPHQTQTMGTHQVSEQELYWHIVLQYFVLKRTIWRPSWKMAAIVEFQWLALFSQKSNVK